MMKKIEAIFPEESLDAVVSSLEAEGFHAMTIDHVKGRGREGGILLEWRAGPYKVNFLPKVMLMIVVDAVDCDRVVWIIQRACYQEALDASVEGHEDATWANRGKLFISPVEQVLSMGDYTPLADLEPSR